MSLLLVSLSSSQDPQKRNSLLSKRAGNRNAFQKSTTTTTEATSYDVSSSDFKPLMKSLIFGNFQEEEYVESGAELAPEAEQQSEDELEGSTTTTTESAKKVRPSVRPFRSNEELLSALKKRRLTEKSQKAPGERAARVDWHVDVSDNFDFVVDLNLAHSPFGLLMKFTVSDQLHDHQFHRIEFRLNYHRLVVHINVKTISMQWTKTLISKQVFVSNDVRQSRAITSRMFVWIFGFLQTIAKKLCQEFHQHWVVLTEFQFRKEIFGSEIDFTVIDAFRIIHYQFCFIGRFTLKFLINSMKLQPSKVP